MSRRGRFLSWLFTDTHNRLVRAREEKSWWLVRGPQEYQRTRKAFLGARQGATPGIEQDINRSAYLLFRERAKERGER